MSNDPNDYRLPPFPKDYQGLSRDWLDYGHACADAARAPLAEENARLLARIAELETNLAKAESRGDNHWETLRSIRHIAKESGDLVRIVQWVNDAGSGYTDTAENTLAGVMHDRDRLRAEVEALRAGIQKALDEIDDDGPKALKYARQELGAAIAQPSIPWVNPLAAEVEKYRADEERLEWLSLKWGGLRGDYAAWVLRRGGTGDLSDIRSFVDAARKGEGSEG